MRQRFFCLVALTVLSAGAWASAGRVDFAVGEVKALAADGRARPLAKGDEFNSGDTIATGGDGRVWLRFTDGAQVSLQPQSEYRIDDYKYEGKTDGEERGFFSLLKGGLRTITGWVGRTNKKNYGVNTAVATIGIRGTEYSITYGNSITVSTGEGQVEVCNGAGCLVLTAGESAYVADENTKPVLVSVKADLPPTPPLPDPQFSVGNDVNSAGGSALINGVPSLLPSGGGYSLAWAGQVNSSPDYGADSGTATFGFGTTLTAFTGTKAYSGTVLTDVGSDGVLGWGRWVAGSQVSGSSLPMTDVHYVVGIPTTASDLAALAGAVNFTADYTLTAATAPTAANGQVGSASSVSGSLSIDFQHTAVQVSLAGSVGAVPFSFVAFGSLSGPTFSGSSGGSYFSGFVAGAGASKAGLTYQTPGGALGAISGAAIFGKPSFSNACFIC